jgi:Dolichyl-phosphate-mannose-protein mannosyltransferase
VSSRGCWQLPFLIALSAALTLGTAGWGSLYNETDGQYGGAAKVMARSGSWLIPENDGIPRLVKPPLLYWALAASMKIFGVTEFAARLPNALAIIAWVAVTFLIGKRMGGDRRGLVAGIVLLTSLGTFTLGRIVMPEPMFSAFIAAAIYCVLRGVGEATPHRRAWFLGFWLCASLASFTKGWHGLLYPLAIVVVAALLSRHERKHLKGLLSWQGALLFLLINFPWYIYVESRFPGYLHNLLVAEQLGHVIGASSPATSYADVPRTQFLLLHLAWFFPWSVTIVLAIPLAAGLVRRQLPARSFSASVVVAWIAVVLGSVLLAGQRQDYYAMSMWPALALTVAWILERPRIQPLIAVLAIALVACLAWSQTLPVLAPRSGSATLAERATAWTTLLSFDRAVWETLLSTAWLSLGGAVLFALVGLCHGRSMIKLAAVAAAAVCLDLGAVSGTSLVAPYFSLAKMAKSIPEDTDIVYDGGIDTGSSLLFYSDSQVILLDQNPDDDFIVRKFGIGRDRFLTISEFVEFWKSATQTVFITEESKLAGWREILGMSLDPAAQSGTQILVKKVP